MDFVTEVIVVALGNSTSERGGLPHDVDLLKSPMHTQDEAWVKVQLYTPPVSLFGAWTGHLT